jgi:hypothetical protein
VLVPKEQAVAAVGDLVEDGGQLNPGETVMTITKTKLAIALAAMALLAPAAAFATHSFSDVPDGQFYTEAVEWAKTNGMTTGCGDGTTFCTNDPVTRAENITFAKRYDDFVVQPALTALTSDIATKADDDHNHDVSYSTLDHNHDDRYVVGEALDGGQLVLAGAVSKPGSDWVATVGDLPAGITVDASNGGVGDFSVAVLGVDGSGGPGAIRAIVTPNAGAPTVCYQAGSGAGPTALSATIKCALVDGSAVDVGFNFMLFLES